MEDRISIDVEPPPVGLEPTLLKSCEAYIGELAAVDETAHTVTASGVMRKRLACQSLRERDPC